MLSGTVNAEQNGFSVSRETVDGSCTIGQAFAYIEDSSGNADFKVTLVQLSDCTILECSLIYTGTANRI